MPGNAGEALDFQNTLGRDALAGAPVGNDTGVVDLQRRGCGGHAAKDIDNAVNGGVCRIHAVTLSRSVNKYQAFTREFFSQREYVKK